ncbi:uncharacterized protein LOC110844971 [Folsomia candida]|nr:uncharacterized protein LOC110844971 [Folsomia candida]
MSPPTDTQTKATIPAPVPASNVPERIELYRRCSLGAALEKTILENGTLSEDIMDKFWVQYDVTFAGHLARTTPRLKFKAKSLSDYKIVHHVHSAKLQNIQVALSPGIGNRDRLTNTTIPELVIIAVPSSTVVRRRGTSTAKVIEEDNKTPKFSQEEE